MLRATLGHRLAPLVLRRPRLVREGFRTIGQLRVHYAPFGAGLASTLGVSGGGRGRPGHRLA
ncbi:MAG TPA: hypothetical protein VE152_06155, partial [Acidimicrobiales bacterium]|nr:hypothetical protein [Acidimicrobiales bacterium]